jgi:hypothetical protein
MENRFVRLISVSVEAQFTPGLCKTHPKCTRCRFGTWFAADLLRIIFFSWNISRRSLTNAAKFPLFFWECSASVWELQSSGMLVEQEDEFGWLKAWFEVKIEWKYLVKKNYKWNPNTMDFFKRKFTIQFILYIPSIFSEVLFNLNLMLINSSMSSKMSI